MLTSININKILRGIGGCGVSSVANRTNLSLGIHNVCEKQYLIDATVNQ